jgi:hypothetical protein
MYSDLRSFIIKWNNDYPIDHWYRNKHGIRFNSSEHRACSFIDMFLEFIEERELNKYYEKQRTKVEYKIDRGDFLIVEKEEEQTDEVYDPEKDELKQLFDSKDFDKIDKLVGNG